MRLAILIFASSLLFCAGQDLNKAFVGKERPGAVLERFTLKNGKAYEGIWDATKSRIHVVQKSDHVSNLALAVEDISSRKTVGDGSKVKLLSDRDLAEKNVIGSIKKYETAIAQVRETTRSRTALHRTYKDRKLPSAEYKAVMVRYKAADDAVEKANAAFAASQTEFSLSLQAYKAAGGKTEYELP